MSSDHEVQSKMGILHVDVLIVMYDHGFRFAFSAFAAFQSSAGTFAGLAKEAGSQQNFHEYKIKTYQATTGH